MVEDRPIMSVKIVSQLQSSTSTLQFGLSAIAELPVILRVLNLDRIREVLRISRPKVDELPIYSMSNKMIEAHSVVMAEVVGDAIERSFASSHEREYQQHQVVEQRESERLHEVEQTNGDSGHTEVDQQ